MSVQIYQAGGGSGGGAPTDAKYIVSAANGTLSAEVIIPGLAGHADRNAVGGAGVSHEFDSGASPLSWSAAVDAEDVNSTVPSHLYIADNGASETLGTYDWSPAGAFDLRCKISFGAEIGTSTAAPGVALLVGDSTMTNRCIMLFTYDGAGDRYTVAAYTYAGTYTVSGAINFVYSNCLYLRITRDGSNNVGFYYSKDGITWLMTTKPSFTYTQAKAGLRLAPASIPVTVAVDWIRSDV